MLFQPGYYKGRKTHCEFCKKKFRTDEGILWDRRRDLIFCDPGESRTADCVIQWSMSRGLTVIAEAALFPDSAAIPPGYGGEMASCTGCGREFRHGEDVYADLLRKLIFCSDTFDDCIEVWKDRIGQKEAVYQLEKRRFHGNT